MKLFLQTLALLLILALSAVIFHFLNIQNISTSLFPGLTDEIKRADIGMSFSEIRLVQKEGNKTSVDLRAASGFINQTTDTVELFSVEGDMKSNEGEPVNIRSKRGKYLKGEGVLLLSGEIVAIIDGRVELETESIRWDGEKRVLTTNDFVTITNTDKSFKLSGRGLEYLPDSEEITIKEEVSAIFFKGDKEL